MDTTQFSVQELTKSEMMSFEGGFLVFVAGLTIGIMLNEIYHDSHRYV